MEEAFVADYGIYYLNKFITAMEFFVGKIIFVLFQIGIVGGAHSPPHIEKDIISYRIFHYLL